MPAPLGAGLKPMEMVSASPADRIELRGIRALGVHGVSPEEQTRAQPFTIDLDLTVDLRPAGQSDDLTDTIHYGDVADAVVAEVAGPSAALLERLAERIATRVLALTGTRATSVTVTVHKLRPPVAVDMASAGVRVTRP
ncbi:MAG: 7,8-dihydroneopterin aldolase/epimerase/oxygenase [Acidimicrobiaceae bacterium]|nr:7,8-dihydroneopterin aldolase/epimerase/oxygenase [Acidimicrobiaceae bacterium]